MGGPIISSPDDQADLLELARAEPLPEVVGYWGELHGIGTARELGAVGAGGDLFVDGSLGSHTAALSAPYRDRPDTSGLLRFDTAEITRHVRACEEAGLQAGFHAIGDAAVDQLLAAIEAIGPGAGTGHRVEHAEYVRDPARLAASGLVASMQPVFDALWGGVEGLYADRLGPERALALNRMGDLAAAGVPLAFGSDTPVTEAGPWAAVRAAAYPHDPSAAVSPRAAFAAHTAGGYAAAGRPGEGRLAVGAPATFAVWTAGGLGADGLPDLRPGRALPECLATVRAGTPIFDPHSIL
jgi:predicted amidohydrolase YtcJ